MLVLLVKGFAVWLVVRRRRGFLRETTSYVAAPRCICLPLHVAGVWSSFVWSCLSERHAVPACVWCPGQVVAVETVKGLTGDELAWWNSVKSSSLLQDETVGSFLGLPGREARRDLLHEASQLADGTYAVLPGKAQVLADALVALLPKGALLLLWGRALRCVCSGPVSCFRGGASTVCTAWRCAHLPLGASHVLTPCVCDVCAFASHLRCGAHVECAGAPVAPL